MRLKDWNQDIQSLWIQRAIENLLLVIKVNPFWPVVTNEDWNPADLHQSLELTLESQTQSYFLVIKVPAVLSNWIPLLSNRRFWIIRHKLLQPYLSVQVPFITHPLCWVGLGQRQVNPNHSSWLCNNWRNSSSHPLTISFDSLSLWIQLYVSILSPTREIKSVTLRIKLKLNTSTNTLMRTKEIPLPTYLLRLKTYPA